MYKVIGEFVDLRDNCHTYHVGDKYPRDGVAVSAERISELSTTKNRRGMRLIKQVEAPVVGAEEPTETEAPKKKRKKR